MAFSHHANRFSQRARVSMSVMAVVVRRRGSLELESQGVDYEPPKDPGAENLAPPDEQHLLLCMELSLALKKFGYFNFQLWFNRPSAICCFVFIHREFISFASCKTQSPQTRIPCHYLCFCLLSQWLSDRDIFSVFINTGGESIA